jgi:hypothetical protein
MRVFAAILLLLHINFSMFIPQLDELDVYDPTGLQLHDVNSLSEYISSSLSSKKNHYTKKDGDDDNARYFQLFRTKLFLEQPVVFVKPTPAVCRNRSIPLTDDTQVAAGFTNTISPPPKA